MTLVPTTPQAAMKRTPPKIVRMRTIMNDDSEIPFIPFDMERIAPNAVRILRRLDPEVAPAKQNKTKGMKRTVTFREDLAEICEDDLTTQLRKLNEEMDDLKLWVKTQSSLKKKRQ